MKDFFKRYNLFGYLLLGSACLTLVSFIWYCVNQTTGYAAGSSVNGWAVTCFILAFLVEVGCFLFAKKLPKWAHGVSLLVAGALLVVALVIWIMSAVPWAADVWFIPVNYPAAEGAALWNAIGGVIIMVVGYCLLIAASVPGSLLKAEEKAE